MRQPLSESRHSQRERNRQPQKRKRHLMRIMGGCKIKEFIIRRALVNTYKYRSAHMCAFRG